MNIAGEKHPLERLWVEVGHVRGKVAEMDSTVAAELPTESGISYLQVKNHALLMYTKMELFFTLLKLEEPVKVKGHPVFKELVRYRTLLERIRPLDRKMKYQVDKMLKVALSDGKELDESLSYAPNPGQLAAAGGPNDNEEGDEGSSSVKDGIYRAPRLAAVPYEEEERAQIKQAKLDERNRKRLQKSTILAELREEFSERPAEILASGTHIADKETAREEAEKKDFEESRFVRVVTSRKDKIRKRQREMEANRTDNVGSIDNFASVQDILSLDKTKHRITTPHEPKKVGGKTGGIFSHVDALTDKKRRMVRNAGNSVAALDATTLVPQDTSGSVSMVKKVSGKKKKVLFKNLFS
ncbi:unnamed protein product [Peronospora belbahrii]|uniref:Neuroguidin n=1 Tax=Peronospora belbahrii TaxID=622444 RepID=A0AAU9L6V7_9STRA|nr:unnamed protein product [Peronospora belbahrii]CAH0520274.1 unnamed protein product [Peronospora belbahrii]